MSIPQHSPLLHFFQIAAAAGYRVFVCSCLCWISFDFAGDSSELTRTSKLNCSCLLSYYRVMQCVITFRLLQVNVLNRKQICTLKTRIEALLLFPNNLGCGISVSIAVLTTVEQRTNVSGEEVCLFKMA